MARDIRELILSRLFSVLEAIAAAQQVEGEDVIKVYRNQADFQYDEMPAYTLLDGLETKGTGSSDKRGPQVMILQPQIFYVPKPTENPKNEGVGPDLSGKRNAFIKAIMGDGQLADLVGDNGYVEYRGMETDMQAGADDMQGRFRLDFAFAYVLNFNKL